MIEHTALWSAAIGGVLGATYAVARRLRQHHTTHHTTEGEEEA